jgi:choline dehydrogenase-like flavoprotein
MAGHSACSANFTDFIQPRLTMIIDARRLIEATDIRGSIAIIGGGAAGVTLALELAEQFKDVLLLESGATDLEKETQDLYDGKLFGHTQPDLRISRLRFLGGSTNHWGGLCFRLDPIDFEHLPDRSYSGWPFGFATLTPFYDRACRYCEIDAFEDGPSVDTTIGRLFEGSELTESLLEGSGFQFTEFRYSRTKFGQRYLAQLSSSDRIKLYLNANVIDIVANESKRAIQSLEVRTLNGCKLTVRAVAFILCCGGIENARILLNCTRQFADGLGNQYDLVGRFFMDHLGANGLIVPQSKIHGLDAFLRMKRTRVGLMNSAQTVRQPGRRGCSLFIDPTYPADKAEWIIADAMQSRAYRALQQIVQYAKHGSLAPDFGKDGCAVLEEPQEVARVLYHRLRTRLGFIVPKSIWVAMEGEQSPNPASRVSLSEEVDALGMRRPVLNWQIDPVDGRNLYQAAMELARCVGRVGLGRMYVDLDPGDELLKIQSTYHHMGTTRMHDDPRQGVVDQHCAMHGLSNFYIAGSSVFPTSGRSNPTLTIVALAIRLADHLKRTVN